ncbi:MAG: hypothetical protein JNL19_08695 [Burkholderiales bacterium]|nr:hypothetical protein [Burkholderiales bacterium]
MNIKSALRTLSVTLLCALVAPVVFAGNDKPVKEVKDPPVPQVVKDWGDMIKCASCQSKPDPTPKEKKDCTSACKRVGMDP